MPAKNTPDKYHALAEQRGFQWIDEQLPTNSHSLATWRCSQGHEWKSSYHSIHAGNGCPHCSGRARKTSADYQAVASERGFQWLESEVPEGVMTKTRWRCSAGHEWDATYNGIANGGYGCPHCAGFIRKTAADYHALAAVRGFEWIGTESVLKTLAKTRWRCPKRHEWDATFSKIQLGRGCPVCANRVPKAEEDYHALAAMRGFTWIGVTPPQDTRVKTLWRCSNGHEWMARYHDIENDGLGCPNCLRQNRDSRRATLPERYRLRSNQRRARKRALPDDLTLEQWQRAVDYFNGCCAVCGRQLKDMFQTHTSSMDHWIPLTSGGATLATNIVPLCHGVGGCNNSKRDRLPEDWLVWKFGKHRAATILARVNAYFASVREQD